ncbi:MAG: bile acid:sodium symporter [Verrucomicrobia bacterium]|nr:bile acid:sodium symporter [Verrucomicrobiota bacterium]
MPPFLARNWFALSLPLAVGLAWILPDLGWSEGPLKTSVTTKAGVALIFLIQGLTLPSTALRQGVSQWRLHVLVQSITFLGFPALGIVLDRLAGGWLAPDLRLGFLYLAVLPSTITTSVILTGMAGGNTVGALFNAVLSSLLGVFVTPLWVAWLMKASGQQQPIGPVILEIVTLLLVPLAVGQGLRPRLSRWADRNKKPMGNLSSGIVLFIVYAAFCNSVKQRLWTRHGVEVLLPAAAGVILLFVLAVALTEALARALALGRPDLIAARCCGPQKTLASGVPMAKIIFGAHPGLGLILLPVLLYHPLQLVVCGALASRWGREAEATRAPSGPAQ